MLSFISKYKAVAGNSYGWSVDLTCGQCNFTGKPRYEGWSRDLKADIGTSVIFAKVACPKCGRRLTNEAGRKFLDLFEGVSVSEENQNIVTAFIIRLILVPAVLAFLLFFGMQMDWWGWGLGTVWILVASAVAIPLLIFMRNYRIARLRWRCDCGNPAYEYMGTFDNTCCYRCFSCGKLLKLRD